MFKTVTLLSSMVETPLTGHDGEVFSVTGLSLSGEPYADALVAAVAAEYHRVTGRPRPRRDDLLGLADREVTLLIENDNDYGARFIQAVEATLVRGPHERLSLRSSGTGTSRMALYPDQVLDAEAGHRKSTVMARRVEQVRACLPTVGQLTQADLLALPQKAPDPAQIGLAVFGTWRAGGDTSAGAIWLLHSYERDDDIAEGYLILRPEDGVSEHGSVYGRHLLTTGGRIVDAPALSFQDAIDLGDLPYPEALARFVPARPPGS